MPKPPKAPKATKQPKAEKVEPPATIPIRTVEPANAGLDLLHKAVSQLADEDGWARLDTVGTYVLTLAPDFDTRAYGHSKLSNLVTKSGQFDVRRDPAKFILIRSLPYHDSPPFDDELPF